MRSLAFLAVVCAVQFGCSQSPDRPVSTMDVPLAPKETTGATAGSANGQITPAQQVPVVVTNSPDAAIVYPERNEVLAILVRARELQQQWQYQTALELVSHALDLDPHSPAAQTMEREIAEFLKRLRVPGNQQRIGSALRAV